VSESNEQPIVSYDLPPGHPLEKEWATYRRELPRLLAEGQEGRFVLVRGGVIDSIWDTHSEAVDAGYDRFGLERFMVHQIRRVERPVRMPTYYSA
jgi:hypothetical protein